MPAPPRPRAERIAVLCAMESELVHLRRLLPPTETMRRGRRTFERCRVGAVDLTLGICGIGMSSAAAVTEAVVGDDPPGAILNFGCAGAHRPELLPGDVVVVRDAVPYDQVEIAADGSETGGHAWFLRDGAQLRQERFPMDASLLAALVRLGNTSQHLPEWPSTLGWPAGIPHRTPRVTVGTVCSANRWNRAHGHIEDLVGRFDSYCEDMEAGAIASVCASHEVAFAAVKDISNNELLHTTTRASFAAVSGEIGRRAALVVLALVNELGGGQEPETGSGRRLP